MWKSEPAQRRVLIRLPTGRINKVVPSQAAAQTQGGSNLGRGPHPCRSERNAIVTAWSVSKSWLLRVGKRTVVAVRTICGLSPAQRDDGDRHALPGRHRRSWAATTPAVVTAWQATCTCVSPMASVCCTPDASALWFSCGSILRGSRFSNASVNLLFTI